MIQAIKSIRCFEGQKNYELILSVVITEEDENCEAELVSLHSKELGEYRRYKTSKAKKSFLLGKISAKLTFSEVKRDLKSDIFIDHGLFGQPILKGATPHRDISLSHTEYKSLALNFPRDILAGCDIEDIKDKNMNTIQMAITPRELDLCQNNKSFIHACWSARESLSKALKLGFLIDLKVLEVNSLKKNDNIIEIQFTNFPILKAYCVEFKETILSLVIPTHLTFVLDELDQFQKQLEELTYSN
jgi:4'-phosphopantetheinyl transferase